MKSIRVILDSVEYKAIETYLEKNHRHDLRHTLIDLVEKICKFKDDSFSEIMHQAFDK